METADQLFCGQTNTGGTSGFNFLTQSSKFNIYADDTYAFGTIHAQAYNYDSLERLKKNISKFNKSAIDIVKQTELYSFNYKTESDEHKKHIGFVIGEEGRKYKTPEQVISNDREGIDSYTMTSILWKAVQELTEEIEKLKGGKANG